MLPLFDETEERVCECVHVLVLVDCLLPPDDDDGDDDEKPN